MELADIDLRNMDQSEAKEFASQLVEYNNKGLEEYAKYISEPLSDIVEKNEKRLAEIYHPLVVDTGRRVRENELLLDEMIKFLESECRRKVAVNRGQLLNLNDELRRTTNVSVPLLNTTPIGHTSGGQIQSTLAPNGASGELELPTEPGATTILRSERLPGPGGANGGTETSTTTRPIVQPPTQAGKSTIIKPTVSPETLVCPTGLDQWFVVQNPDGTCFVAHTCWPDWPAGRVVGGPYTLRETAEGWQQQICGINVIPPPPAPEPKQCNYIPPPPVVTWTDPPVNCKPPDIQCPPGQSWKWDGWINAYRCVSTGEVIDSIKPPPEKKCPPLTPNLQLMVNMDCNSLPKEIRDELVKCGFKQCEAPPKFKPDKPKPVDPVWQALMVRVAIFLAGLPRF